VAITQVAGARLGSLVLGSADPLRLGAWYRDVDDFAVVKEHLHTLELTWVGPVERTRIGTIATLEDSDGNHINILELLPDYLPAGRP
jgi:hypothetical protein